VKVAVVPMVAVRLAGWVVRVGAVPEPDPELDPPDPVPVVGGVLVGGVLVTGGVLVAGGVLVTGGLVAGGLVAPLVGAVADAEPSDEDPPPHPASRVRPTTDTTNAEQG
jgi:hypothetical protein